MRRFVETETELAKVRQQLEVANAKAANAQVETRSKTRELSKRDDEVKSLNDKVAKKMIEHRNKRMSLGTKVRGLEGQLLCGAERLEKQRKEAHQEALAAEFKLKTAKEEAFSRIVKLKVQYDKIIGKLKCKWDDTTNQLKVKRKASGAAKKDECSYSINISRSLERLKLDQAGLVRDVI